MITHKISFNEVVLLAKERHSNNYYYTIYNSPQCFTGNFENDINAANKIIDSTVNDSSAGNREAAFKWAYDRFYGMEFNHKLIHHRPSYPSHFTTRLEVEQIQLVRTKFKEWINYKHEGVVANKLPALSYSHKRISYCFETLLKSGMRVGELANINFRDAPGHRLIYSKIHNESMIEIIINTEKTRKKREIYVPLDAYQFFMNDKRKLSKDMIVDGFTTFRRWANLPFILTAHVCRRTLATLMYEAGVDIYTIAMVLGNTPGVVMNHYILSSRRNYDACEIAHATMDGYINKTNNIFFNQQYLALNPDLEKKNQKETSQYRITLADLHYLRDSSLDTHQASDLLKKSF